MLASVMNRCLLAKWIVKIERVDKNLCCDLSRSKCLGETRTFG
jgi:hypothetical protein